MKALFKSEEELNVHHHLSAENANHFREFPRSGAASVEGFATRSIDLHAENIDPRSSITCTGLSVQGAAGLVSMKVGKRKSRVSRKVPIKVFSADATNFMAMVHRLTGFQSSAYLLPGSPRTPLLKPLVTRPLHPFVQGLYMPDSPAGDKTTANFSNGSFSCALSERRSPLIGRQMLEFVNDVSLPTEEGFGTLHDPSNGKRVPPYMHNPAFEALQWQGLSNSNRWGSSSGVAFLASQEEPRKDEGS